MTNFLLLNYQKRRITVRFDVQCFATQTVPEFSIYLFFYLINFVFFYGLHHPQSLHSHLERNSVFDTMSHPANAKKCIKESIPKTEIRRNRRKTHTHPTNLYSDNASHTAENATILIRFIFNAPKKIKISRKNRSTQSLECLFNF